MQVPVDPVLSMYGRMPNGLDFNPRVEPKANASCDAERRPSCQGVKGIGADRFTTERLLLAVGARKSDVAEEWTLNPLEGA
jgi:hypothetical protein